MYRLGLSNHEEMTERSHHVDSLVASIMIIHLGAHTRTHMHTTEHKTLFFLEPQHELSLQSVWVLTIRKAINRLSQRACVCVPNKLYHSIDRITRDYNRRINMNFVVVVFLRQMSLRNNEQIDDRQAFKLISIGIGWIFICFVDSCRLWIIILYYAMECPKLKPIKQIYQLHWNIQYICICVRQQSNLVYRNSSTF